MPVHLRWSWVFFGRRGYRDGRLLEGGWISCNGREVAYAGLETIAPGVVTFGPDAPALRDLGVTAEVRGSTGALQGYRGEAGHRVRVIPGNLTAQRAIAVHDTRRASALALGAVAITALALAAGRVAGSRGRQPTDAELPTAEPAADLSPVP